MFSDPQFWVAVAFVSFIAAIFNPVRKILTTNLDAQIKEIKDKIDEAENLKNETQVTLSEVKKRQNDLQIEIKDIQNCYSLYPSVGENLDYLNLNNSKITFLYRKLDQYSWQYCNKGFFNFKNYIPRIISTFN